MPAFAPIPLDEEGRLQALRSYAILDTPPDERFDLFTRLTTWLYDVPVAAINFVDSERTFFKSLIGMQPYEPRRCTSFCAHAIAGEDAVMVVEDLAADMRFHNHALVAKGMRFYAGVGLQSASGYALGTLCIGDKRPRRFEAEARHKLIELGKGVGAVLDLHQRSLHLLEAATQDALTGLHNRRHFDENLQRAVRQAKLDAPCTLLSLDLDRFKHVNDTLGHAAGDALLCEVGRRLTRTVRAGDIVARLGGDEFMIMMQGRSTVGCAEQLAQRVLHAFAEPFAFEGRVVEIRSSIGIARCPFDAADAAGLLRCADSALYEAKRSGRNQHRVYGASRP